MRWCAPPGPGRGRRPNGAASPSRRHDAHRDETRGERGSGQQPQRKTRTTRWRRQQDRLPVPIGEPRLDLPRRSTGAQLVTDLCPHRLRDIALGGRDRLRLAAGALQLLRHGVDAIVQRPMPGTTVHHERAGRCGQCHNEGEPGQARGQIAAGPTGRCLRRHDKSQRPSC
jgi:hypothetical protein